MLPGRLVTATAVVSAPAPARHDDRSVTRPGEACRTRLLRARLLRLLSPLAKQTVNVPLDPLPLVYPLPPTERFRVAKPRLRQALVVCRQAGSLQVTPLVVGADCGLATTTAASCCFCGLVGISCVAFASMIESWQLKCKLTAAVAWEPVSAAHTMPPLHHRLLFQALSQRRRRHHSFPAALFAASAATPPARLERSCGPSWPSCGKHWAMLPQWLMPPLQHSVRQERRHRRVLRAPA